MNYLKNYKQTGTALISALILILFITSTIAIWIHQSAQHIRQQHILQENQQATLLLQGVNIWAAQVLKQKSFHRRASLIATLDASKLKLPKGWRVQATVEDAQNKFNLNNVGEQAMQLMFFLLLQNQLKQVPQVPLKTIFYETIHKVEPVAEIHKKLRSKQAEEDSNFDPISQPFATLSEWKTIKGVNPLIYKTMSPYFTVLPEATPININTCSEAMLKALKPGFKKEDVQKLIAARSDEGIRSMDELFAVMQDLQLPAQNITINSQYFWINIQIKAPSKRTLYFQNLLFRQVSQKNKSAQIKIINQFQLS